MDEAIGRALTSRTYVALAIDRGIVTNGNANITGCHMAIGLLREVKIPLLPSNSRAY
jgi:hypothetical protein